MRTRLLFTLMIAAGLCACEDEPKPTPPPETPPAQPAPKGTSVSVGHDGVKVESKDADVQIGKDTASIELPPKK